MKLFLAILSLLCFQLSFSQMRVEDIKNDSDIVRFMHISNLESKKYEGLIRPCNKDNLNFKFDSSTKHLYESISNSKSWFALDINKDHRLDLVLCGCVEGYPATFIFLSTGEKNYKRIDVTRQFSYNREFAYTLGADTLVTVGVKPVEDTIFGFIGKYSLKSDTIIFSKGRLTEQNSLWVYRKIDSIKISVYGSRKTRQNTITVTKNANIKWHKEQKEDKNWVTRKYLVPNSQKTANDILAAAETLPYYKYASVYETDLPDCAVWYLDVFFADHTKQEMCDFGGVGPFGLQLMYKSAEDIYSDKNWKLLSVKKHSSP